MKHPCTKRVVRAFLQGSIYFFSDKPLEKALKGYFEPLDGGGPSSALIPCRTKAQYNHFRKTLDFSSKANNYIYKIQEPLRLFDGSFEDCLRLFKAYPEAVSALAERAKNIVDEGIPSHWSGDDFTYLINDKKKDINNANNLLASLSIEDAAKLVSQQILNDIGLLFHTRFLLQTLGISFADFRKIYNGFTQYNVKGKEHFGPSVFKDVVAKAVLVDGTVMRTSQDDHEDRVFTLPDYVREELTRYTQMSNRRLYKGVVEWLKENAPKPYKTVRLYRGFQIPIENESTQDITKNLFRWTGLRSLEELRRGVPVKIKRSKESSWSTSPQVATSFMAKSKYGDSISVLVKADVPADRVVLDFNELPMSFRRDFPFHGQGEVVVDSGPVIGTIASVFAQNPKIPDDAKVQFVPRIGFFPVE